MTCLSSAYPSTTAFPIKRLKKTRWIGREAHETYGADAFVAKMGAEAVREVLEKVDLKKQADHLQEAMTETKSKQIRKKLAKRIKLLQGLQLSKSRPDG